MLELDRRKRIRLEVTDDIEDPACQDKASRQAPRGFICPLTMEVMFEPVLDAEGNTYERVALLNWLENNRSSPISRQPLNERMLLSNNALRESIHEFMGVEWVRAQMCEKAENEPARCASTKQSRLRAKIDCFLQNTCVELGGLDLKLNRDGCCAFRYDNITIVLDVPDQVGVFCLYTKELVHGADQDMDKLYRRALELNFLQGDTRGGCLSMCKNSGRKEVMFSYTDRVPEVSARDFSNILLNFVETAVSLRDKLLDDDHITEGDISGESLHKTRSPAPLAEERALAEE